MCIYNNNNNNNNNIKIILKCIYNMGLFEEVGLIIPPKKRIKQLRSNH